MLYFVFISPRLIDMGRVYQQTNHQNLEQAFSVAERDLGVTRLLDPEGTAWQWLFEQDQKAWYSWKCFLTHSLISIFQMSMSHTLMRSQSSPMCRLYMMSCLVLMSMMVSEQM